MSIFPNYAGLQWKVSVLNLLFKGEKGRKCYLFF